MYSMACILKEWLSRLLGHVQVLLHYVRHNAALHRAHLQRLLIGDSAAHVPAYFEQLVLDALAFVLKVL